MGGRISWVVVLFDFFKAPPKKGEPHRFGSLFVSACTTHTHFVITYTFFGLLILFGPRIQ